MMINAKRARILKSLNISDDSIEILKEAGYTGIAFDNEAEKKSRSFCSCGWGGTGLEEQCPMCMGRLKRIELDTGYYRREYPGSMFITPDEVKTNKVDVRYFRVDFSINDNTIDCSVNETYVCSIYESDGCLTSLEYGAIKTIPALNFEDCKNTLTKFIPHTVELIASFAENSSDMWLTGMKLVEVLPNVFNLSNAKLNSFLKYVTKKLNNNGRPEIPKCPSGFEDKHSWDSSYDWSDIDHIDSVAWVCGIPPELNEDYNMAANELDSYRFTYSKVIGSQVRNLLDSDAGKFLIHRWRNCVTDLYDICQAATSLYHTEIDDEDWDLFANYLKERCDVCELKTIFRSFIRDIKAYHAAGVYPNEDLLRVRQVNKNHKNAAYGLGYSDILDKDPLKAIMALAKKKAEEINEELDGEDED